MRKLIITFRMALRDAKANIMHTLLSVLGIVIGVAALVAILSLIDGMEKYAHEQITRTTSLESIMINPKTTDRVDGVAIKKKDYAYIDEKAYYELQDVIGDKGQSSIIYTESGWIYPSDTRRRKGVLFRGMLNTRDKDFDAEILAGDIFSKEQHFVRDSVVVLNKAAAEHLGKGEPYDSLINKYVDYEGGQFKIIGVIDSKGKQLELFGSYSIVPEKKIREKPPMVLIKANSVERVPELKQKAEDWIKEKYGDGKDDFIVATNEGRVEQANQGFLVFRIVMGLIVGISVLVGGIGVMNVLLISVTERTAEIGVRKAVGANRKDIVQQFLAESVTISAIGSVLGMLLGIGFTMIAVPIVKSITKMPFEAAYTLNTLLIIGVVAIVVGVVFGTYPAMKAAKLDPVEAIRRE